MITHNEKLNENKKTETDPVTGLSCSDPRYQLLKALRMRLASLQAAEATADTTADSQSTLSQPSENTPLQAETTESQPLTAETPPEQSRNGAETQPKYFGCSAETNSTPSREKKRKITESALDDLPAEMQAYLLHLLNTMTLDRATLEIISKPPYGLGIDTSRGSLYRFQQRHNQKQSAKLRDRNAAELAKLLAEVRNSHDVSITATHLIAIRLLKTAVEETSKPADLLALSKAIDRLRATEHAERRLHLAEMKAKQISTD